MNFYEMYISAMPWELVTVRESVCRSMCAKKTQNRLLRNWI